MMQSYIDNEYIAHFFDSFVKSDRLSKEEKTLYEIIEFLRSKTDLILKSDFNEILNMLDPPLRNQCSVIINSLTSGRKGTKIKSNEKNAFYPLKKVAFYSQLKKPFSSFWMGDTYKHDIDNYRSSNPYYFLSKLDFEEQWQQMNRKKTYSVGPGLKPEEETVLSSWDQIRPFSHSFRDIIIADRYCLKDKELIERNIIPLIVNLSKNKNILENIILFVEATNSLPTSVNVLRKGLIAENITANIGVYTANKRFHYRKIVTNSVHIWSDDSFDYFEPNGFKTHGATLTIEPIHELSKTEFNRFFDACKRTRKQVDHPKFEISFIGKLGTNMLDLV